MPAIRLLPSSVSTQSGMPSLLSILFTLALVFAVIPATAATYYVRTGGGTTTQCTGRMNVDYPGSGSSQPCAYKDLQAAINVVTFGDTIALHAGQVWTTPGPYASFDLPAKGNPPSGTDADYITI